MMPALFPDYEHEASVDTEANSSTLCIEDKPGVIVPTPVDPHCLAPTATVAKPPASTNLAPPVRAAVVRTGFHTRRGAWAELSDGHKVFTTSLQARGDNKVEGHFANLDGRSATILIDGLTAANLPAALDSIMPKYKGPPAKRDVLFSGCHCHVM